MTPSLQVPHGRIPCTCPIGPECFGYVADDIDDLNEHLDDYHNARDRVLELSMGAHR